MSNTQPERVIAYIDGFNLYFGLKDKGWRRYLWLDLVGMARDLLKPHQELVGVKYFTTRVGNPVESVRRQSTYIDALTHHGGVEFVFGNFLWNPIGCDGCGREWDKREEKQTDVAIAVHMICDSLAGAFDTCLLVCGDSDQVPSVTKLVEEHGKRVVVACPPERISNHLNSAASAHFVIGRQAFANNHLPDYVTNPDTGYVLYRPAEWWDAEEQGS